MPTGTDYPIAIVIVNEHEPHGEVATRLLELADEKGYDARTVEAQRGEHDSALSFRVPEDVAEAFNAERAKTWPEAAKIENPDEDVAGVNEDAYAADQARSAKAAQAANAADQTNTPARAKRSDKA